MGPFHNALSHGITGNPSFLLGAKLPEKSFMCFFFSVSAGPLSVLIIFVSPIILKACKQWSITFWKASPVCKKAKRNREHVSMQTCTYFCFPISRQCVTSIYQSWFGTRPQGVTPRYGTGESRIHSGHCFTIIHACSLEILWQSLKVWVDKWNLLWSCWAGTTGSVWNTSTVRAWSITSCPEPGVQEDCNEI